MYLMQEIVSRFEIESLSYSMVEQLFRLQASPVPSPSPSWVEFVGEEVPLPHLQSHDPVKSEPAPVTFSVPEAGTLLTDDVTLTDPICACGLFFVMLFAFLCMSRRVPAPVVKHPEPRAVVVDVQPLKPADPAP